MRCNADEVQIAGMGMDISHDTSLACRLTYRYMRKTADCYAVPILLRDFLSEKKN